MGREIKRARLVAAAALTGVLLVPLAVFAGSGSATNSSAAQYQYKITICHHTHSGTHPAVTISVSVNAWPAHRRHGDTIGPCPPTAPTIAPPSTQHGNSGESHGNSGESHGNSGESHGNSGESHGNGHAN
jgi:hypothetical protein